MTATVRALESLRRKRPEWDAWLAVIADVLREAATPSWDRAVPAAPRASADAPLLANAGVVVDTGVVRGWLERLTRATRALPGAETSMLTAAAARDVDAVALFEASLRQDAHAVAHIARSIGAEEAALQTIADLLAVPFLHACRRRWSPSVPESWVAPYCPVCGAWPAFTEIRGIERRRFHRCRRCGGEWHAAMLRCPFCRVNDHDVLVTLVPEAPGTSSVIDACTQCRGYVKALSRLQGCSPDEVMLEDLATVDLDLAALNAGYARPAGPGVNIDVAVAPRPSAPSWRP